MAAPAIDSLPGYRRRFIVLPGVDHVRVALEDDIHCMSVTIRHDGTTATAIGKGRDTRMRSSILEGRRLLGFHGHAPCRCKPLCGGRDPSRTKPEET